MGLGRTFSDVLMGKKGLLYSSILGKSRVGLSSVSAARDL